MIHRRKGRKLKRTASHRKATLSNLSVSLIKHKKITTTLAKAKEMRRFIEPLITKSKKALAAKNSSNGVHLRRKANKFLNDKAAVKMLFDEIGSKVGDRKGGYTRVLKLGRRYGDAAEMAILELVDYNLEQADNKQKEKQATETVKKASTKKTSKPAKKKVKKEAASKEK
jgi:large subunit ribosomal protein L17